MLKVRNVLTLSIFKNGLQEWSAKLRNIGIIGPSGKTSFYLDCITAHLASTFAVLMARMCFFNTFGMLSCPQTGYQMFQSPFDTYPDYFMLILILQIYPAFDCTFLIFLHSLHIIFKNFFSFFFQSLSHSPNIFLYSNLFYLGLLYFIGTSNFFEKLFMISYALLLLHFLCISFPLFLLHIYFF